MGNIFRSNEVYKHTKTIINGHHQIIPVRGVYITGEYRPPYYNEPGIHITSITSTSPTIRDFTDVERSDEDGMVKVLNFSVTRSEPTITNYTVNTVSSGEDTMTKLLEFSVTYNQPSYEWYTSATQNAGEDTMVKLLEFTVTRNGIQPITYTTSRQHSTPESMLRLTSLRTEPATIENYN